MKVRVLAVEVDGGWPEGLSGLIEGFLSEPTTGGGVPMGSAPAEPAREIAAPVSATPVVGPRRSEHIKPASLKRRMQRQAKGEGSTKEPEAAPQEPKANRPEGGKCRLEVLNLLKRRPMTSGEVVKAMEGTHAAQAVYCALSELRKAGVVETRRDENLEMRNYWKA